MGDRMRWPRSAWARGSLRATMSGHHGTERQEIIEKVDRAAARTPPSGRRLKQAPKGTRAGKRKSKEFFPMSSANPLVKRSPPERAGALFLRTADAEVFSPSRDGACRSRSFCQGRKHRMGTQQGAQEDHRGAVSRAARKGVRACFRFKRSVPVSYDRQGYIYFTSRLYEELRRGRSRRSSTCAWSAAENTTRPCFSSPDDGCRGERRRSTTFLPTLERGWCGGTTNTSFCGRYYAGHGKQHPAARPFSSCKNIRSRPGKDLAGTAATRRRCPVHSGEPGTFLTPSPRRAAPGRRREESAPDEPV